MLIAVGLVAIAAVVIAVTAASRRWNLPAPLVLMLVGLAGSWLPFVPELHLDPEIVLLGVLPPLLYTAAIQTSAIDLKRDARSIAILSVLLVAVTAAVVGLVASALLGIPYAAGFALGAVVAPPDAVAATAIAKRVGLPRRVVNILEGESLVNDATAITCLRVAIVAIGGTVSAVEVGGLFLLAAGGGVVIGLVVALLFSRIRRHVTNPVLDTACSLLVPFVAYLPAEAVHSSGVVAVVTAGIVLGHRSPVIQTAESRVTERITWRTIQFLLENTVFLLIGLQTRWIVADVQHGEIGLAWAMVVAVLVLLTAVTVRMLWLLVSRFLLRRHRRLDGAATAIIGWAGMRGVVTLAAAQLLPEDVPHRDVMVFVALVVTVGTLLLQGLTLGPLASRLGTHGPDAREDALQVAHLLQKLGNRSIARLDDMAGDPEAKALVIDRIRDRANAVWERLGQETATPAAEYRRLRLATLAGERADLLAWRYRSGRKSAAAGQETVDQAVLADVLALLDEEETTLGRASANLDPVEAEPLTVRTTLGPGACPELAAAPVDVEATSQECLRCLEDGTRPVSLRLCLTCGEVSCCDSSVGQHATEHFRATGHPVMRSYEPGERWRWCYVHERLG